MIVTVKSLSQILNCSDKTARKRANEIKSAYKIKELTIFHIAGYFNLRLSQVLLWQNILNEHDLKKRERDLELLDEIGCPDDRNVQKPCR